jgi:hypothetical protein
MIRTLLTLIVFGTPFLNVHGQKSSSDTLYFPVGVSSLNYDALIKLDNNLIVVDSNLHKARLFIVCDTSLRLNYDQRVGIRRALMARSYLMAIGIDSASIALSASEDYPTGQYFQCINLDSTNFSSMNRPYTTNADISFVSGESKP